MSTSVSVGATTGADCVYTFAVPLASVRVIDEPSAAKATLLLSANVIDRISI